MWGPATRCSRLPKNTAQNMIPVLVRESFFEVWLDMAQEMRACGVGVG